jgi:hypothetical protein
MGGRRSFVTTVSPIVWATVLARAAGDERPGLLQLARMALMRTLDAGTMGGRFVISTLIGLLTSGIEAKLEELCMGRSRVLESGHTVILGWSPRIFTVLSELVLANANQRRACIVVLADRDRVEVEDEIRARASDPRTTRIVCQRPPGRSHGPGPSARSTT